MKSHKFIEIFRKEFTNGLEFVRNHNKSYEQVRIGHNGNFHINVDQKIEIIFILASN